MDTHSYTRLLRGWIVRTAHIREYPIFTGVSARCQFILVNEAYINPLTGCRKEQREQRKYAANGSYREGPEIRVVLGR